MIDQHGRPLPPIDADEIDTLLGYLDYHRATVAWKVSGLTAAELARTTAASTMTLGGLLKHLALVEDTWFSLRMAGAEPSTPWREVDWQTDPDWEWRTAVEDSPEYLHALWSAAVERSRAVVAEALTSGGLDQLARRPRSDGDYPSLRWILLHLIEEYARHNGHADLLRESIDASGRRIGLRRRSGRARGRC